MTGIVLSFGAAAVLGLGLWLWIWPGSRSGAAVILLGLSVAIPLGLGLASLGFFVWFILLGLPPRILLGGEIVLGALLIVAGAWAGRGKLLTPQPQRERWSALDKLLGAGCLVGVALAAYGFLCRSVREPHGLWDAWAIWNLKARFLFRGAEDWQAVLSPLLSWSHPDYPLMIPGLVARGWTFSGGETTAVPIATGFVFTLASAGILSTAVWANRGRTQGRLAGLVLLGTPFFLAHGASQYVEIPVACFMLASLAVLQHGNQAPKGATALHFLAGLLAGMAAWTKNEGILFLIALLGTQVGMAMGEPSPDRKWTRLAAYCAGAVPLALVIIWFKVFLAPLTDLLAGQSLPATLARLADSSRHILVAKAFAKVFLDREKWNFFPVVLPFYALLVGVETVKDGAAGWKSDAACHRRGLVVIWVTLALTIVGTFLVYVVTPRDLDWHLRTSVDRIFLELWPSILLGIFLTIRSPDSSRAAAPMKQPHR